MKHIIKSIIIVLVAITSMLAVGAISMISLMQKSFADKGSAITSPPAGKGMLTI